MKKLLTLLIGFLFAATLSAQHSNTYTYPFYIGKTGTSTGSITLYGTTSGTVQLTIPDIAGTGTKFQLPSSNGTSGYVLRTDGSGVLSWISLAGYAPLNSPALITPNLGTPSAGTLTNCTFPTLNQNTTGSAATLTTARTIGGVSFDGSANITVATATGDFDVTGTGSFASIDVADAVDLEDIVPDMIGDSLAAYRAAATPLETVTIMGKIVKKTIGWDGAIGTDFVWAGDADHTAQNLDLGAIIPAKAKVIQIEIVCTEALVGCTDMTFRAGNASAGEQFIVSLSCDELNEVVGIIDPALPQAVIMNWAADTNIWIGGDPTDNTWADMTAGLWTVYVTYINYEDI